MLLFPNVVAERMLTTTAAARVAAVAPSTIKRWADQGLLSFSRTAGGHRRFEHSAIERLVREQASPIPSDSPISAVWIHCLVAGWRHLIDGMLLEARSRLGSWCGVADELGAALAEMGTQWECGRLTIAEEHVGSDALARALARVGDMLPIRVNGPKCVLACAGDEEHTLGLSLAELCLRELGWTPLWLGRRSPITEIVRVVRSGDVAVVALSASSLLGDERALRTIGDEIASACKDARADLVLGGSGAWPAQPSFGVRVTSFASFRDYLKGRSE